MRMVSGWHYKLRYLFIHCEMRFHIAASDASVSGLKLYAILRANQPTAIAHKYTQSARALPPTFAANG